MIAALVAVAVGAGAFMSQKDRIKSMTQPVEVQKICTVEGVTEYRLANGLKVLLMPDASKPTATVNMTYLVGSRHESYGETGMAHLLEHLMFKGSKNFPEPTKEFTRRGFRMNGSTWLDRTNYFVSFNADEADDNLNWALRWSADAMVNSFIAQKDLDTEMTVVRNEFEMGENNPVQVMLKRMQSMVFDWHNYGNSTIGARSDIENVKIENLQAFYRKYYQPDNAVLTVSGKIDPTKTLKTIVEVFGAIAKPERELPQEWTQEPVADGPRYFEIRRKGEMKLVSVAYRIPSAVHPDAQAVSLGADVLGDTPRGRLHKALVETGLASQVFAWPMPAQAPGIALFGAILNKDTNEQDAKDILVATIEKGFIDEPIKPEELAAMVTEEKTQYERLFADPEMFGTDISDFIALGDWRLFFVQRDNWDRYSIEDVQSAWKKYFVRDNRVVGIFIPDEEVKRAQMSPAPSVQSVIDAHTFKEEGESVEAFEATPENINARTERLEIGQLQVALLPKQTRSDTVNVRFHFRYGNTQSRFGQREISVMMSEMLERGTDRYTREQITDAFTNLKIEGGIGTYTTTRDNLVSSLILMSQLWQTSSFPEKDFKELKQEYITYVQSKMDDPRVLARDAMVKHFNTYPKGDPRYGYTSVEKLEMIREVSLEDVKRYWQEQFGVTRGEVAIVGSFDAQKVKQALAEHLSKTSQVPYERTVREHRDVAADRIVIDTPDKENATIMARINFAANKNDDDAIAMHVANWIFGGSTGLSNRLMMRLRQKEGLSYGVGSTLSLPAFGNAAHWSMNAILAPQNMGKAEDALKEEIERVLKDGFTQQELDEAKKGFNEYRAVNRSQDPVIASQWISMMQEGVDWRESQENDEKVQRLTLEQVNAAIRKMLDPSKITIVMAGDLKKVQAK